MATWRRKAGGIVLLLLLATTEIRADGVGLSLTASPQPGVLFSLPMFVRNRRAARVTVAVGMVAGFACMAASLACLYGDSARFALDETTAVTVRRDVLAFSAGTALLSLSAAAFDALRPAASPTSGE